MNLSWVSTALALAVTVGATFLRLGSHNEKQLAVKQANSITQTLTVQTVATYFQSSTTAIQDCNGQISTVTQAQAAVATITTTVQTIQAQFPDFKQCRCTRLGQDDNFHQIVIALFTQFQGVVDTVNLRFSASLSLFESCWKGFESYFGTVSSFATNIQLNLSTLLHGVLNLNILSKIGLNLNFLGLDLGIGLDLGLGVHLRD